MNYRKANLEDIPQLVELRKIQLIDEGLRPINNIDNELYKYFQESLEDGSLISWILEVEDKIIATSGICFYQYPPSYANPTGKIAYVTNMYTKKEFRGKGIASWLLKLIINEAKERNYNLVRLHASVHGKPVYKTFGFTDLEGFMQMQL
ncbi:MAG: GNAT family N-acetyltransferase [Clostridiaceae bacterium]